MGKIPYNNKRYIGVGINFPSCLAADVNHIIHILPLVSDMVLEVAKPLSNCYAIHHYFNDTLFNNFANYIIFKIIEIFPDDDIKCLLVNLS